MVNYRNDFSIGNGRFSGLFSKKRREERMFPIDRILTPKQKIEAYIDEYGCGDIESAMRCVKKSMAIMRGVRSYAELDSCASLLSSRIGISKEIIIDEATGRLSCM